MRKSRFTEEQMVKTLREADAKPFADVPAVRVRFDGPPAYNRRMRTTSTPKDQLRRVLDEQPDDSSFEEIIKELAFAAMVERGLADVEAGRTISHEEMRRTIESWRK